MTPVQRKRVEEFIKILRAPKEEAPNLFAFDMTGWGVRLTAKEARNGGWGEILVDDTVCGNKCGTVCCAFGLAGLSPTFQAQGLRYDPKDGNFYFENRIWMSGTFSLAARFFGLGEHVTQQVFDNKKWWYSSKLGREITDITPTDVADVLQLILDGKIS